MFAICCLRLPAAEAAASAKSLPEEAYMMPLEEFISRPHLELRPYFATSATLPPWAPTPGTSKKWSGHISRIPASISGLVAPATNIILSGVPHSIAVPMTFLYRSPSSS